MLLMPPGLLSSAAPSQGGGGSAISAAAVLSNNARLVAYDDDSGGYNPYSPPPASSFSFWIKPAATTVMNLHNAYMLGPSVRISIDFLNLKILEERDGKMWTQHWLELSSAVSADQWNHIFITAVGSNFGIWINGIDRSADVSVVDGGPAFYLVKGFQTDIGYATRNDSAKIAQWLAVAGQTPLSISDVGVNSGGAWKARPLAISFGQHDRLLDFAQSNDLGRDVSGNEAHFPTVTNVTQDTVDLPPSV